MKIFSFLFIALIIFSSCEKTVTINIPEKAPRLVVNAILNKNQVIELTVGKSRHILESNNTSIETYVVKNAVAVIFENNIPIDTLVYQAVDYTYRSSGNKTIREGYNYTVKVTAPGFTVVEATTIVPSQSEIADVKRVKDARVNSFGDQMDEITVTLNDPAETNFYLLQFMYPDFGGGREHPIICVSTTDKDLEQIGENADPLSTDNCYDGGNLIMRDNNFNGRQKQLRFHIESTQLQERQGPGGQVKKPYLKLSRITEDYFKYIKSYDVYYNSSDNPFAEPANVFSNVQNGYGIFSVRTSVTRDL